MTSWKTISRTIGRKNLLNECISHGTERSRMKVTTSRAIKEIRIRNGMPLTFFLW